MQFFETEWDEIHRRLPEIAEIGYEGLWIPPPQKSPVAGGPYAGGGNVGYSHFDKFDVGDIPQRGSLGTRYGTRAALRNMVDSAHRSDIKIYPDIVMNHYGNGPDFHTYPGTRVNDFHGWFDGGQPGGFKRPIRMNAYDDISGGFGGTFQQELVSLIDLQTEHDNRFSSGGPNYATPPIFYRHPGQPNLYPYGVDTNETTLAFLNRWIAWLGQAMDYDGVRLDAPKHMIAEFFGLPGVQYSGHYGFNHEIQVSLDGRRGRALDGSFADLYLNYVRRDDALIFSEFFIGSTSQVDYWRTFGGQGIKMRYLDFPRTRSVLQSAFGQDNYNLDSLSSFAGFSPAEGVMFVHSHDEDKVVRKELAYAYILTHDGLPSVYFTGNNLDGSNVNQNTWVLRGHGGALGDYNNGVLPNLVCIHNQFARGKEWERWSEGDFYAFERYEDVNSSSTPESPEGLLLVALNDSGVSLTRTLNCAFPNGTVLHDYTGNQPNDVTVSGGQVTITVPGNSAYPVAGNQGWVCYAPYNASANGDPLRFSTGGNPANSINWIVPGGRLASAKSRQVTRLTQDTVDIDVYFNNPPGGGVDSVIAKWGDGARVSDTQPWLTNSKSLVSFGFQNAVSNTGFWRLTASLTNVSEGLHLVKGRCFNSRPGGHPALFQTFAEAVYVDRHGPDVEIVVPAADQTIPGDCVVVITNRDRTAYSVEAKVNNGAYAPAHEIMKGSWRFNLTGLSSGNHTLTVRALEADYGNPRQVINSTEIERTFTVTGGGPALAINHAEGAVIALPFFQTTLTTDPGINQNNVTLYWDGYELAGLSGTGTLTHVFDGRIIRRDALVGAVTQRLWGAFVNGPHFFEARAVNAGQTTRVSRTVLFNLYGGNHIDSDGDGLPDDVEMPFFSSGTAPGPNKPWPGDCRSPNCDGVGDQDMIPNYGEMWSRLNPMAHDTTYSGTWDGDEDWDGDGVPNLCEVIKGYLDQGNPYYYSIYNAASKPADCNYTSGGPIPSQVQWFPLNPPRCLGETLTITYVPHEGPLMGVSPIWIGIGFNNFSNVIVTNMTSIGGSQWQYPYAIPTNATAVDFYFRNENGALVDNNNNADWHVNVGPCPIITNYFVMDGQFDSAHYEVAFSGMKILAAVKDATLYVATWSANGNAGGSDHFLYVTDRFGMPEASPWGKAGQVNFNKATKPHLVAESAASGGFHAFNISGNGGRAAMGPSGAALEGELNLIEVFGHIPDQLYIAAVAMGDNDGGGINSQCPPAWDGNNNLEITEFQAVPVESIRDENLDGYFDGGKPQLWSVVDGNTNDANYNLRRFFLDERVNETRPLTIRFKPNTAPGDVVSDVEIISNLNRRDFATPDWDLDLVGQNDPTAYFRAYPMSLSGDTYTGTLTVHKCGAYRVTVRYKVNGNTYYYTDHGLRRDLAVVVSPRKALDIRMYEVQPMIVEATDATFFGRSTFRDLHLANTNKPDFLNANHYPAIGVNMVWLQPIHPIGFDNRETDPEAGQDYDPGSPYAVRNYWKVNSVLGDPATEAQAMHEFTNFVQQMDGVGVGVMLDGTFNHSAWDCEIGEVGVDMFSWATNATELIRHIRPEWYSRKGDHGQHATYYNTVNDNNIAPAPDRFDFGKWNDVADFFFGRYDALVQGQTEDWKDRHQFEQDHFEGFPTNYTRDLWEYFAYYPIYWLEKSGHPAGTSKTDSDRGIDGLRCDFAQGLPNQFWEYCINKTRRVKWDFVFMAESLDGFRTINGNARHGIGYRSARHFDILNEDFVFYWRDQFFGYPAKGPGSGATPNPTTAPTFSAFDSRKNAFDLIPILLNLVGHDEVLPHNDPYRILYAYAQVAALDGAPMLLYGQEAGARNSHGIYGFSSGSAYGSLNNANNNWNKYELNFGKGIPNFKRYNHMQSVWSNRDWNLQNLYGRINNARRQSVALRSQQNYFLGKQSDGAYDVNIFAVAKFSQPGISAATQEVVFAFVNNNPSANPNVSQTFRLNASINGRNWFGIDSNHLYTVRDLLATNPTHNIWNPGIYGTNLINNGIFVGLPYQGQQAHYLRLVDLTEHPFPGAYTYDEDEDGIPDFDDPDDDNDGLPDTWEIAYGLDPFDNNGIYGAAGDFDGDGVSNWDEFLAGTNPDDSQDYLKAGIQMNGSQIQVRWNAVPDMNYKLQHRPLPNAGAGWQTMFFGTAFETNQVMPDPGAPAETTRVYRIEVNP